MSAEQIQPTDQTHVFEELKAYDWDADTHFQVRISTSQLSCITASAIDATTYYLCPGFMSCSIKIY